MITVHGAGSGCDPRPSRDGMHVPRRGQIAAAEDADEVVLAHDVVLLAVGAPPEYHLVGEAGRPPELYSVQSTGDLPPQELTSGQYPVDWLPTSLTVHRSASRMKLISPALRTVLPPAQATCSLRRGASRSTPSMPTTKVNGSVSSAADCSAIQPPKSAAEPIRRPPPPDRTTAFSSTGPTYRQLRPRLLTSANLEHFRHTPLHEDSGRRRGRGRSDEADGLRPRPPRGPHRRRQHDDSALLLLPLETVA